MPEERRLVIVLFAHVAAAEAGSRAVFASADDVGLGQLSIAGPRLTSESLLAQGRFAEADALLAEAIELHEPPIEALRARLSPAAAAGAGAAVPSGNTRVSA